MADLAIVIDTKSLVDAKNKLTDFQKQMGETNSILGLSRALDGVEANVKSLLAAQNKGQLSANSFKQGLLEQKKALVATGMSFAEAKQKVDQLAAALRNQQAADAAAAAAKELARAQKEAAAATKELERAQKQADDAHELTRQRYVAGAAAQARLKQAQKDLSAAYRAGAIDIDEYRQALILLNQQNQGNLRGTNNLGVAMQQTGYQVGDFVVQVQSGTDPMVAFGQQATQLVGVMYLLPPAVLASTRTILGFTFSVSALAMTLGIAVPVLAAVGAAYLRFKKESDKAGQAADSLREKMKSLTSSIEDYRMSKEALSMGLTTDQFVGRAAVDEAKKNLDEARADLEGFNAFAEGLSSVGPMGKVVKIGEGVLSRLGFGKESAFTDATEAVTKAVDTLKGAEERLAEQQSKRFADQKFNLDQELALQQKISGFGKGSKQVKTLELEQEIALRHRNLEAQRTSLELKGYDVDALKEQVAQTLALAASNEVLGEQLELQEKLTEERKEFQSNFDKQLYAQENALLLLTIEATEKLGKKSSAYRAELLRQESVRLSRLVDQKKITEESAEAALAVFEATMDISSELEESANGASRLADGLKEAASAMASLSSFGAGLDRSIAVAEARVAALKAGTDAAVAGRIAGRRADLDLKLSEAASNPDFDRQDLVKMREELGAKVSKEADLLTQVSVLTASKKGSTSGSKSLAKEQKDYLKELSQEVELKRSLIGLSEEDTREKELIFELEKRKLPVDLERVKSLVAAEAALKKVTEAEERRTKTFDLIEDNMSSAFLSMVDGSKSVEGAFKDMLRNILKHLYEQQVSKPIAEGLSGLLKAGLSGLAGGGISTNSVSGPMTSSPMPPTRKFAVGGVVHRATNFNMMGGGLGQMGEAGPEAIMPLKRGANGKLGVQMEGNSEGNVVVNQTFQFSANGDESVKKLIAQAAPKIAQMTQRQIVDSRRRGGGMKETFG